jgi:N-acetylglucosaminyl-diphospho-decaprenol L-rhamnosyltransferase
MKLLVVIVNFRVTDLTIECLHSLSGEIGRVSGARVGLCENGTGGDAADRLNSAIELNGWGSWVQLTVIYPNRGFTGGNNAVIRPALASEDPPEYVLLLNADTLVLEHALDSLVEFMDSQPEAGIAGSQLLYANRTVGPSPFRFEGIAAELDRGLRLGIVSKMLSKRLPALPTPKAPARVGWVAGASMILRRTMLEEIGLLDEDLYTYFDDPDICLRALRAGWQTWYVPASRIIHFGGESTLVTSPKVNPRRPTYWFQARRRFFLKHYGPWYTAAADAAFIFGFAIWRLRRRIQRKPDTDPPHMLFDSIRNSVFFTGFKLTAVENPAMKEALESDDGPQRPGGSPPEAGRWGERDSVRAGTTDKIAGLEPRPPVGG